MRIVLAGTELAPVHPEGGALELLLCGWAEALVGAGHEVWLASVPGRPPDAATALGGPPDAVGVGEVSGPEEVGDLARRVAADVVVCNNRPGWLPHLPVPTVLLLHNWPDAWGERGTGPVGPATRVAAVSAALAAEAARVLSPAAGVAVVGPWVHPGFTDPALHARPEDGLVLCPNRLLAKKGVAELCAAAGRPALAGARILVTDHLSPWTSPTAEHLALRSLVAATPGCELVPAASTRSAMAGLYLRAGAVACPSVLPEGLGLSALEAQACGVPVASSGRGGLAEASLLPELVADPSDADALAGAVAAALEVPGAVRGGLRTRVASRFGVDGSTAALLGVLRDAAGR